MFEDVLIIISFTLGCIWFGLQIRAALDESRYWRRMTAMFIRPTHDRKDFGLPEVDED